MSQVIGDNPGGWTLEHAAAQLEGPPGHHRARSSRTRPSPRSPPATAYHRAWVYKLKARYEAEGETALEPRSRRPKTSPTRPPPEMVELIVRLRKDLDDAGLDAGPDTIAWHLTPPSRRSRCPGPHQPHPDPVTVLVAPEPRKRPRSSYIRFEAAMPNETWQSDFTHYRLANGTGSPGADVEIISWLDDCSRYALHVSVHTDRVTTDSVMEHASAQAADQHGIPASTLTDNGMVYTVRFAGGRRRLATSSKHELRRPARHPEELPPQPPHHLREGREIPADHEEVADAPSPSSRRRMAAATGPARRIRRGLQPAPAAPIAPPRHPGERCTTRRPKAVPDAVTAAPRPTTGSATTPSTKPATVTLRYRQPTPPHRHRPNPRRHLRHPARPGPPRPRRRRRHRRTPPRADPRPQPRLPAHRSTQRPTRRPK